MNSVILFSTKQDSPLLLTKIVQFVFSIILSIKQRLQLPYTQDSICLQVYERELAELLMN